MNNEKVKKTKRDRRRIKIRAKIKGTKESPRLSVFKSNKGMYLQLIDDDQGKTLISAHSGEIKLSKTKNKESKADATKIEFELGKLMAKKALGKKITKVVFDRGGFKYHGRVKAAAEGARKGGLKF